MTVQGGLMQEFSAVNQYQLWTLIVKPITHYAETITQIGSFATFMQSSVASVPAHWSKGLGFESRHLLVRRQFRTIPLGLTLMCLLIWKFGLACFHRQVSKLDHIAWQERLKTLIFRITNFSVVYSNSTAYKTMKTHNYRQNLQSM
jgi:hypothetical protein